MDNEFEKIKLKFEAIWKARDNELNAVRERSLMVWGFLMFCYGGYGVLAMRLLFPSPCEPTSYHWLVNLTLLFLSLICLRLSAYWVQMAKGAKAWAEYYDYMAECFQHDLLHLGNPKRVCPKDRFKRDFSSVFDEKNCQQCDGDVSHVCLFSVFPLDFNQPNIKYFPDFDHNCLTTKGGAYSPAKIMVAVARLSLCVSSLLVFGHAVWAFHGTSLVQKVISWISWQHFAPAFILVVFLICPAIRLLARCDRIRRWFRFVVKDMGTESDGLNQIIQIRKYLEKSGGNKQK